jgi:hypothetical protein
MRRLRSRTRHVLGKRSGYDTYLSRCHSPCKSINRSPMFGCNGSCYAFVLVNSSKIVIKNCHQFCCHQFCCHQFCCHQFCCVYTHATIHQNCARLAIGSSKLLTTDSLIRILIRESALNHSIESQLNQNCMNQDPVNNFDE